MSFQLKTKMKQAKEVMFLKEHVDTPQPSSYSYKQVQFI